MTGSLARALRTAWRVPAGRAGALLLAAMAIAAVAGPALVQDPLAIPDLLAGATPPGADHPFGTDENNRDVLARVVHGARISMSVAGLSVLLSLGLGALVGTVSGYRGGWVDAGLMRLVDAALAVPRLFLLLILTVAWDPLPLGALILVLGGTGWFGTSRIVRGEVLRLRHEPFVVASTALGAGPLRVIFRHLVPNVAGPLLVTATLAVGHVILLEAGLSFLGVGVAPPTPSWGGMIQEGRYLAIAAPWITVFPGLAIVATVLAVNLIGEALRAAFDPRSA